MDMVKILIFILLFSGAFASEERKSGPSPLLGRRTM
jgi:hypothetical protein